MNADREVDIPRFYVFVPETVQTTVDSSFLYVVNNFMARDIHSINRSTRMVAGRLIAQGVHIGRKLENYRAVHGIPWLDITTIVLSVRNTKELTKVSNEVELAVGDMDNPDVFYEKYYDTNFDLYGTKDKVHTATIVGPVYKENLESVIGHLELYA